MYNTEAGPHCVVFAGTLIFQLRRRSSDSNKRRNKRQRAVSHDDLRKSHEQPATQADKLPYLLDLNPRGDLCQYEAGVTVLRFCLCE